jgi:hypothetical protein
MDEIGRFQVVASKYGKVVSAEGEGKSLCRRVLLTARYARRLSLLLRGEVGESVVPLTRHATRVGLSPLSRGEA